MPPQIPKKTAASKPVSGERPPKKEKVVTNSPNKQPTQTKKPPVKKSPKKRPTINKPNSDAASRLGVFRSHSVDLTENGSQAIGDCPFCGKESHFYANVKTGQWDCKVCGESGNSFSFLAKIHRQAFDATSGEDFRRLSQLRGIPVQTFRRHGLAFDSCENCWLIPYRSSKGSIINLCRYWESSGKKYMTKGLPVGLYGLEALSTDPCRLVFLVEGAFDAIALDHHLRNLKAHGRYDILAVPGANTFKQPWAKWLDGRKVRIVFDNDEAGRRGVESVIKRLREAGVKAVVERFNWPTGFPSGCDINDLVKDYEVSIPQFTNEGSEKIDLRKKNKFSFNRGDELGELVLTWIWEGHIPRRTLVTLDGEPGIGKSTLARNIAARVTVGQAMPFCERCSVPKGDVLYFTSEDSEEAVRDSVEVQGGDITRLYTHSHVNDDGDVLDLIEALEDLKEEVQARSIKLIIVDNGNSFLGDHDAGTDAKARRNVSGKLHAFAQKNDVCLLMLRNWPKSETNAPKANRGMGPSSMQHIGRATMYIEKTSRPGESLAGELYFSKVSDAPEPEPIPFTVENLGGHKRRVIFGKVATKGGKDVQSGTMRNGTKKKSTKKAMKH